jgi:hypothetical protein
VREYVHDTCRSTNTHNSNCVSINDRFRASTDGGVTWSPPVSPDGTNLSVANPLFAESGPGPVKLGAPHVVDHGPENVRSPGE